MQTPHAVELVSGVADQESISITVYNGNFALVKEQRRLALPAGLVELRLREVSAQMQAETASLHLLSGGSLQLHEQNFDYDLLSPAKLLEKFVGQEVSVVRTHPTSGEESQERATVLANNGGVVLRFDQQINGGPPGRIETGIPGRIVFDSVPANLRDRPTLSVLIETDGGEKLLELSYLTTDIAWQADYVADLSADGKTLALAGWVTLSNRSGTEYRNANLQLVAGKVNRRARRNLHEEQDFDLSERGFPIAASASGPPRQEQLLDFHLYSYDRTTTIADNQTKQLALLATGNIPVRREYRLNGAPAYYASRQRNHIRKSHPSSYIEFDNRGAELEKPLPAGIVRVYAKDSRGGAQFVGEDQIPHTPKYETVKLNLGEAFDITIESTQTDCTMLGERGAQSSHQAELRNVKDIPVQVCIEAPIPGEWHIVRESHPHKKESANLASWTVEVPALGSTLLEYTVRARW